MNSTVQQCQISFIGETAHSFLISQLHGKVLAVVSQAIYLVNERDDVFWLATAGSPMHSRCIRISGSRPNLGVDASFEVNDHCILFLPESCLNFGKVSIWIPPRLIPGETLPLADISGYLGRFISTLEDLPTPAGFGNLIPEIVEFFSPQRTHRLSPTWPVSVDHARPIVSEIARACLAHDIPRVLSQAENLIGLGEGLTPSGDDFVGGLLFCSAILKGAYEDALEYSFPDLLEFVDKQKKDTNLISHTFVRDHARGCAMDVLHQFISAILTGQSLEKTRKDVLHLIQVGHSTGWDLLAGVLTGMLLAIRDENTSNCWNYLPISWRKV